MQNIPHFGTLFLGILQYSMGYTLLPCIYNATFLIFALLSGLLLTRCLFRSYCFSFLIRFLAGHSFRLIPIRICFGEIPFNPVNQQFYACRIIRKHDRLNLYIRKSFVIDTQNMVFFTLCPIPVVLVRTHAAITPMTTTAIPTTNNFFFLHIIVNIIGSSLGCVV